MNEVTSPTFLPLYQQIKSLLTQSLESGEWRPGEPIPSEMDLAARYKVSQGTVRKAIDELAAENIVVRRQGKGTYVATHAEERTQYRFLRLMGPDVDQEYPQNRLIDCRKIKPSDEVAAALELKSGESIIVIRRVLIFSGSPTVFDEISVPASLFKGLTTAKVGAYKGSMYSLFEEQFGVRMIRAQERIKAVAADTVNAGILEVNVGAPLLCVERVAYTYGDKPVEWRQGLYSTQNHYYMNELG